MSPSDERYWTNAHAKAASLQSEVAAAWLRAFAIVRNVLDDTELARLIASGQLDRVLSEIVSDQLLDRAMIPVRQRIRDTTQSAFRYTVPSLPGSGKVDGVLSVSFDHLSEHVVTAIRSLEDPALAQFTESTRDVIRAYVENGIRDGANPRTIARSLRAVVGMSPTQAEHAANYEASLRAAEKPMPAERIEKAVAAYRKRAVAVNTETVARTTTLNAFKEGQRLAWQSAIDAGIVDGNRLVKTWRGVMDDRERPTHVAMEGQTVPFDQPFTNGQMTPGENEYNCRCLALVRVA